MKFLFSIAAVVAATFSGATHATAIDTTDATAAAAFQTGLSVNTFESVSGRTPFAITQYDQGTLVDVNATVFDQLPGVQFSVGGAVGTNAPALYQLGGAIAGDAHSGNTVLGPVDFDGTTKFAGGAFIEVFFPTKVASVGFWLNPSLDNVTLIAANTNFAFSGEDEITLETATGAAGSFVGISRATADIGGFKIIGLGDKAFSIDDFSYGTAAAVPEPGSYALLLAGVVAMGWRLQRRR